MHATQIAKQGSPKLSGALLATVAKELIANSSPT